MERREYERLAATEERLWWFGALHRNLIAAWRGAARPAAASAAAVLDAGCGTGGFLAKLAAQFPGDAVGLDRDAFACALARGKSGTGVVLGSIDALPFADRSFDAIFSADVLCHRGIDQRLALAELRRCLRPGGVLVLNLPAYRWMLSAHDRAVDNARRYGSGEVARLLAQAGFAGISTRYWNSLLFPLMVLKRKLLPGGDGDVALMPAPLERCFAAIARFETWLATMGLRLPFGGSIVAVGIRP